ncbi:hypothetical protein HO133_004267 [Letharia lupina]|uniref:AB hydrolase-1 domain-containing protein n=1 Tax=Letharia lupina TaxID=560253 RepID=A0A8H6FJY1_9LECA|nr:uncharacterized protein HO133_004267 [Letharia lupina]KAF6229930.1 hypothetical protein HO133_004267 [Letharia lupina]
MDPYTTLYPTLTPHTIPVTPTVSLHALTSPPTTPHTNPPLLLLHGFPQNLLIWHRLAPHLTGTHSLVLLDLRGYGKSSKPAGGADHAGYGKSAMAADCAAAMTALGHARFDVCGHDRGARVAHRLCVGYPERVRKALVLDVAPTLAMYERTDMAFARAYWHWFFLIQDAPLPEGLMVGGARGWIENTMGGPGGAGLGTFDEACVESYVGQMGDAETVHGMCEDYRAAAGIDLEEAREDVAEGRKIACPLRVLWGKKGVIEAQFDALAEWRKVSEEGVVSGESVDCGHYIPEEAPDAVVRHIREFLRD